ncbi:MAG TPA: Gfo/Idh/MocA family oxidoreductase [Feifaniaceae bacterium]|nr:Gfo/Idh/MocA family oxidoreductase [Feifaniaceae bacterium]
MINIGVIGCGKIAQTRHLPEYAANPAVRLYGLYDLNAERTQALAEQYGAKAFSSYQELLDDPAIDAVSVCTANASHCEVTLAALKKGKHVLCEKPMATTLAECKEMVEAAKKSGKFLMIGHNQRLARAHARAKELIVQGEIGEIVTFRTTFGHGGPETWTIDPANVWFFDKKLAAFGAMADLGIHKTDLIQFLTGQRVAEVSAYLGTLDKRLQNGELIGVDDNAICIYRMSGGAVGTMTASWTYYGAEDNSTVLYGTNGVMRIYDDPNYSIAVIKKNGERILYDIDRIQTNDNQTSSGVIDLWVDSLVNNKAPEISGEEAYSAMRAVFAAMESAQTGRRVTIG